MSPSLAGRRLVVVEDEYFLADDLAQGLRREGAEVVGLASSVDAALALLDQVDALDGVLLDLNLQGEMAIPVADALIARGIPFVLTTGYDQAAIPPRLREAPRCDKPVRAANIARALFGGRSE